MPTDAAAKTFEVGKTYWTRSLVDYDSISSFTILARTAKQITTTVRGETVKRGVRVNDGVETFSPFGSYSMSPTIWADKAVQS